MQLQRVEFAGRSLVLDRGAQQVVGLEHAADRLLVGLVGPGLEIDQEAELLLRRFLAAVGDRLAPGHIDGERFGDVNMLAGVHRGRCLLGMKVRRRFDRHGVQLLLQQPLVAGQPGVPACSGNLQLSAEIIHTIPEVIGGRYNVITPVAGKKLGNPGAVERPGSEQRGRYGNQHKA